MRRMRKIAGLELRMLFYSPIGWLVLTIIAIQCGVSFLDSLSNMRYSVSLGYNDAPITLSLFAKENGGLYMSVKNNLYLYIPILTMGLMSRELSSGSIKLLLSSPVKLSEIILGKYLAIVTYGLLIIGIVGIYTIIGSFIIADVDTGWLLAGLPALYLLICTYAAIGLFMSCLTMYQVVAAISTLMVLAVFQYIGSVWQDIDFVRDLTYFLSISGRAEKMISGLITTKDVFYYLIIIATFLILCVLRLKTQRESKSWKIKSGRYALLFICTLLLGYITSRPGFTGYFDATSRKIFTLNESDQKLAKQLKGDVKVTTYVNMLDQYGYLALPTQRNQDLDRLEMYKRFIPGMDVSYVYYYKRPIDSSISTYKWIDSLKQIKDIHILAKKSATIMNLDEHIFMPPAKIDKIINLEPEGNALVRKIEYNGKSSFVRFLRSDEDPYAHEAEFMASIKSLLVKRQKVVFVSGDNERNMTSLKDRNYTIITTAKFFRGALINHGFDFDSVNLKNQSIPSDADILVLSDPTDSLTSTEQQKIADYLAKGGNMLITGEPGKQQKINPIISRLGVQLQSGVVVVPDKNNTPGFINARLSEEAVTLDSNFKIIHDLDETVGFQSASALRFLDTGTFKIIPLLLSDKKGWNKQGVLDPDAPEVSFIAENGDQKGTFPLAAMLSRNVNGKEQRIVVSGNSNFMSNGELFHSPRGDQRNYAFGLFGWLSNGIYPVNVRSIPPKDMDLQISKEGITVLMWILKGIVPAIIAISGAIFLYRRRSN